MHRPLRFNFSIIATLVALAGQVHAADWPTRSVTVIVPFGAGGNTDMMARLGAQHLTAKLGQTFVVENKPSAGGSLGNLTKPGSQNPSDAINSIQGLFGKKKKPPQ